MSVEIKFKFDVMGRSLKDFSDKQRKKCEDAIKESIQEVDTVQIVKEEYDKTDLRVRSSYLYDSFKETKTDSSIKVASNVIYSAIFDHGGWNGRGHNSYQRPRHYFTNAANRIRELLRKKIKEKLSK